MVLGVARTAPAGEVLVFAAASLTDALSEIGAGWAASRGVDVRFSFGSSASLARQIRAGAPADVFYSAHVAQMDDLERAGLVRVATRHETIGNTLVVVVAGGPGAPSIAGPDDLLGVPRIALADPEVVPAGIYARRYLESVGLWQRLGPSIVPTVHVRAALTAVASGHVAAGIVYRTDAARASGVRIAFPVPAEAGPDIRYTVAALQHGGRDAEALVDHLESASALVAFRRHGFLVPEAR